MITAVSSGIAAADPDTMLLHAKMQAEIDAKTLDYGFGTAADISGVIKKVF